MADVQLVCRRLERADLARLADIDRTDRIERLYVQHGTELREIAGDFSAPPWQAAGDGPHSVAYQREECERHLAAGATALGVFDGERLVGIGIVTPNIRPGIAQLAYLHVSNGYRGRGIGDQLTSDLEQLARDAGATIIVVSATPSRTPSASTPGTAISRRALRCPSSSSSSPRTCTWRRGYEIERQLQLEPRRARPLARPAWPRRRRRAAPRGSPARP
jgi:ribosomal protein S18 acetylase RimI-like enzyme